MSIVHSSLTAAILAGHRAELESLLAADAVFHSPVRSYRDRRDVVHLLSMIGPLLGVAEPTQRWTSPAGAVTRLRSEQPEGVLDAALIERPEESGKICEISLMLRPVSVLLPTIKRMGVALEADPLPSGRSLG